jgi:hypothetical protein
VLALASQELGWRYGAPFEESSKRYQTDKQLGAVRSAAKALAGKAAARIPPARLAALQAIVLHQFGREHQPWPASLAEQQQLLQEALAVEVKSVAEGWQSHAALVVAGVVAEGEQQQQQQDVVMSGRKQQHSTSLAQPTVKPLSCKAAAAAMTRAVAVADKGQSTAAAAAAVPPVLVSTAALYLGVGAVVASAAASAAGLQTALEPVFTAFGFVQQVQLTAVPMASQQQQLQGLIQAPSAAAGAAVKYGFQTQLLAVAAAAAMASCRLHFVVGDKPESSSSSAPVACRTSLVVANSTCAGKGLVTVAVPAAAAAAAAEGVPAAGEAAPCQRRHEPAAATEQGQQLEQSGSPPAAAAAAATAELELSAAGEAALEEFVRGWRRHFLDTMQPQHLPPFWSVDSRVRNSSAPSTDT